MSSITETSISGQQLLIIERQLNRRPRGLLSIAATTINGIPLVLKMRPLIDDKPFPTLYWLCSKQLCKVIGQIEGAGIVKQLEARLKQDQGLRQRYLEDHQRYVSQRWQAMSAKDRQRISSLGMNSLFDRYGIGGISQWDRIRCLHMQYAQHLADHNCLGEYLDQQYKLRELVISE